MSYTQIGFPIVAGACVIIVALGNLWLSIRLNRLSCDLEREYWKLRMQLDAAEFDARRRITMHPCE